MTVHDWSRVDDGLFHAFHQLWIARLTEALNGGVLPTGYYARPEQHVGTIAIPDVITFREAPTAGNGSPPAGAVAVADAPPRVDVVGVLHPASTWPRTVTVRRADQDVIVAMIEVVSAANKDRPDTVAGFVRKVGTAFEAGVHVLILDLRPPTRHTPGGLHPAVAAEIRAPHAPAENQPADRPVALLSYAADLWEVRSYLTYLAVGDPVPDMPLFLTPNEYVNVPLGPTYEQTFRGLARIDRDRIAPP